MHRPNALFVTFSHTRKSSKIWSVETESECARLQNNDYEWPRTTKQVGKIFCPCWLVQAGTSKQKPGHDKTRASASHPTVVRGHSQTMWTIFWMFLTPTLRSPWLLTFTTITWTFFLNFWPLPPLPLAVHVVCESLENW